MKPAIVRVLFFLISSVITIMFFYVKIRLLFDDCVINKSFKVYIIYKQRIYFTYIDSNVC